MNKILLGQVRMKQGNTILDDFVLYVRNRHTLASVVAATSYDPINIGEKINMLFVSTSLAFFMGGILHDKGIKDDVSQFFFVTLPVLIIDTILWYLAVAEDKELVKREEKRRRGTGASESKMAIDQTNVEFLVCTRNERTVANASNMYVCISN